MTDRTRRRGEKFPIPDPEAVVRRGMRGPPVGLAKCAWSNRRMWLMSDPEALAFVAIVALMLAVAVVVALT